MPDVDRLFAVPLEAFMDERKRLAKELRAAGDKEAAGEVAKWPKPTPPAWALNHLARERPEVLAPWLEAAGALREASTNAARVGGEALRAAMTEHREATASLLAVIRDEVRPAGKPLSAPMLDRVKTLLQAATTDPERAEALRAGRLLEDGAPVRMPAPAKAQPQPEPGPDPEAERRAELERQAEAAEREAERLRTQAAERERAAGVARERLEEAERTLHRSRAEAEAAQAALDEAREQLATAERDAQRLQALLARRQ